VKKLRVKKSDGSHDKLCRIAVRAGFVLHEGKRHTKVKTTTGEFVTTIPRHNHLKSELVAGAVEAMHAHGANIELS